MQARVPSRVLILGVCAILSGVGSTSAQINNATLQGIVTDSAGAALPGAVITVRSLETGLEREATANMVGLFVVNFLPPGRYEVVAERPGFRTVRLENIALEVGHARTLDITLEVGGLAETVNVVASGLPLDRTSPALGTVIQGNQLKELPLNGRHWASLMMLAPGAINTGEGNHLSIRFVGRARDDNNWTFDGIDATGVKDPRQESGIRLIISTDAIAEFRVSSSLYSAEAGSAAGGQVQLVSRAGTNRLRGSLFHFFRDDRFDARAFTDPGDLPPFRLHQFGGNIGGAFRRDETFFFTNYEGLRQRQGETFTRFVPSTAFRSAVAARSPALIPILRGYPTGTRPTSDPDVDEVVAERMHEATENSFLVRVDHRFSEEISLFGRFAVDDAIVETPRDAGITLRTDRVRPSNVTAQLQSILSPNVINALKFGVNRSPLTRTSTGPFDERYEVPGFMRLERSQTIIERGTSFSVLDDMALTRGRHNLKVGGEIRRIHVDVSEGTAATLNYVSRSDFLANRLNNFSLIDFPLLKQRRWYYFCYVQDDIRWKSNLTLNAGLRYEYYSVPTEAEGRAKVFALECGGFCPPGTSFYGADQNNLAPRIGFAWAPGVFHNKTVVRAGFGMYFGPGQNDDLFGPIESSADRFTLDRRDAPALSYPIDPFLPLARSVGNTPRALDRKRRDLYAEHYGLSIQQELPLHLILQVGYIGNQGHKLFSRSFINLIDPATGGRPLPQFGRVDIKRNDSNSHFNGLQLSLQRPFVDGFLMGAQYMWSHSINEGATGGGEAEPPQNVNTRRGDRGNSPTDIRHTATVNWVFELPFGAGRRFLNQGGLAAAVFGGWEVTGLFQARTGRQLTVTVERSSSDLPDGNNRNQRPDRVPGGSLRPPGGSTANLWINPAAFSVPPKGRWGTAGRGILTGPGLVQLDAGLGKRVRLADTRSLEFRWEVFNVFNRAQLGDPETSFSAGPSFGRITEPFNRTLGTGTNRQMQFMVRLNF